MLDGPGERPLRPQAHGVAVGGQPLKAVPVFEIPQLAGVDFIDDLPRPVGAVAAAPEPVAAFDHIVHQGHPAADGHGIVTGQLPRQQPRHHQKIHPPQGDHPLLRHPFRDAGEGNAVPLPKGSADVGGGELHIGALHADPHSRARRPLHQGRGLLGGIQPEGHILRVLRLLGLGIAGQQGSTVGGSRSEGHGAGGGVYRLQIAEIRQIQGVDVLFVREDHHIGPHGQKPLGAVLLPFRKPQLHPVAVDDEPGAVHPAQAVPGNEALGVSRLGEYPPFFPGGQQGISVRAQVLHGRQLPVADAAIGIVAPEYRQGLPADGSRFQLHKPHCIPS